VTNLKNDGPCFVYGLLDPRSGTIFYVGSTLNPRQRLLQHRCENGRCREMIIAGVDPKLEILHECADRNHALRIEHSLLTEYPALVNRARYFTQITGKYAGRNTADTARLRALRLARFGHV